MRASLPWAVALVSAGAVAGFAAVRAPAERAADQARIRGVLRRFVETWSAREPDGCAALLTDDIEYVSHLGVVHSGKSQVLEQRATLARELEHEQARFDAFPESLGFLAQNVALLRARCHWTGYTPRRGEQTEDLTGVMTLVLVKRGGRWLIRAVQSTPAPLAQV